jgi:hypothetical protein
VVVLRDELRHFAAGVACLEETTRSEKERFREDGGLLVRPFGSF